VPREDSELVLSIYGLQRMRERITVGRAQAR
jgi:hypothetical protein